MSINGKGVIALTTTWEDIVCKAKDLADAAGRKATDVADLAKRKIKIAENERAIRDTLEALGGLLYECRKDGVEMNEELVTELVAQVDELSAANEQLQDELDAQRGYKTCDCGCKNPEGAAYCNACGKEL